MQKITGGVIEYSGGGWYAEVYGWGSSWSWAAAIDIGEKVFCQGCGGFTSPAAAERSLKAFIALEREKELDRWLSVAERLP